jgi:hypothetical protein
MNTNAFALLVSLACASVIACGGSSGGTDTGLPTDDGTQDAGFDAAADIPANDIDQPDDPGPADTLEEETFADATDVVDATAEDPGWETVTPPVPWGPVNRGYRELRGIVHLHSKWSHDGCFPDHEEIAPALFDECMEEHRSAPCLTGIDFLMQTDHPSDVRDVTFEEALHFRPEEGDVLVNDSLGRPVSNRVTCPPGSLVDSFQYFLGTEGSKQMPIGLSKPVPVEVFNTSYHDDVPLAAAQAAIAMVHESGGYAFVAHPEERNLSVERIIALPLDGIEIFNLHPMLMDALLGGLENFLKADAFMTPGATNPVPDLALLLLLAPVTNDPIKFDQAAAHIRLSHIAATDIHRNVEVPSLCLDLESCGDYGYTYPNFAQLLVDGGPVILADGDRMDSFARSFRWVANRTLVAAVKADDPDEIRQSVGLGRSYSSFDMMGAPEGFDFFAVADGAVVEMGREITDAERIDLYLKAPTVVPPPWGIPFVAEDAYRNAEIRTRVFKATVEGSEVILDLPGQGREFMIEDVEPAAYRVEVWIRPLHLGPALSGIEHLAQKDFPYIYSNALFIR